MRKILVLCAALALVAAFALTSGADSTETETRKVVFVAGGPSHGYGAHEHHAGSLILSNLLNEHEGVTSVVHQNGWPDDPSAFDGAHTVVIYADGGGGHPAIRNFEAFNELMERGVGVVLIHWGTGVPGGDIGRRWVQLVGANKEANWAVNPHWVLTDPELAEHPINHGVVPFDINDEWYFHLRFRENMERTTPIMSAHPPYETVDRGDGGFSSNPHVRAALQRGDIQHVAWAAERENGGRAFGITGAHWHWNWGHPMLRRQVLNGILWTAHGDVPEDGLNPGTITIEDLKANQDHEMPGNYDIDRWANLVEQWNEQFGDN